MKRKIAGLAAGVFLSASVLLPHAEAVGRNVPSDIFQWVQSTSMAGYYFNKQQICYGVGKDGFIDLNTLIVPTIKIYGDKQIEDVVQKRRWRMEKLDGYDNLVGAADYLSFDLAAGTVTVTEHDDLDMNWWPLTKTFGSDAIKVSELPEKAVDGIFYRAILDYAKTHQDDILNNTKKGVLSPADKKKLEEAKNAQDKKDKKSKKKKKKDRKKSAETQATETTASK